MSQSSTYNIGQVRSAMPLQLANAKSNSRNSAKLGGSGRSGSSSKRSQGPTRTRFTDTPRGGSGYQPPKKKSRKSEDLLSRIRSSKVAMVLIAIVALAIIVGIGDTVLHAGKAYGNVSVAGIDMGGKTHDQIVEALRNAYGTRVEDTEIVIYASESTMEKGKEVLDGEMNTENAELISVEEANASVAYWQANAKSLGAGIPFDEIADAALAVGREDGGIVKRFDLLVDTANVPVSVSFDEAKLNSLASAIDRTIGDPRTDATVAIEAGTAYPIEGATGSAVNRTWLANNIESAMLSEENDVSFVAQASEAPSRITASQAQSMADAINAAIRDGATFDYQGTTWNATASDLGSWVVVKPTDSETGWKLNVSLNVDDASASITKGVNAQVTSEDLTTKFTKSDSGVQVHTEGSGKIPDLSLAVHQLEDALFGENGKAWSQASGPISISVQDTDVPETLSLEDAMDLGIIMVIGEYTTEFSDYEGTESRNHNIKLAADILNNTIVDANGGLWNFNERTGETGEAAGFWAASAIIDGQYQDSIGGGICQVATTVFNAVFEAGLPVVERHNHSLYIESYPQGRDAAVSYPDLDFIWQNNQKSDVLLTLDYTDTTITAKLYGMYTGYTVTAEEGQWQRGSSYGTRYVEDEELSNGASYVKVYGSDGRSIEVKRLVTDAQGNQVADDTFESNYDPQDTIIAYGPGTNVSNLESDSSSSDDYDSDDSGSDDSGSDDYDSDDSGSDYDGNY